MTEDGSAKAQLSFYTQIDRETVYGAGDDLEAHPFFPLLHAFIGKWNLHSKKCLEIGSAKGLFQDLVEDYTGVDVAENLRSQYHKAFVVVNGATLPFPDGSFDAIFTYATHEHIPEIEVALDEIVRVLKPGGVCLFAPAWHTRPWFADGLAVRPFRELSLTQRAKKLSIPVRDCAAIRWPLVMVRRLWRLRSWWANAPVRLRYRRLVANYNHYWQSDSDACNSLDPFDVIVWFRSRGLRCEHHATVLAALTARTLALEVVKPGGSSARDGR